MISIENGVRKDIRLLEELINVSKPLQRVMVFIDGGYLRALCKQFFNTDQINFTKVGFKILETFEICSTGQFRPDLIRIYYYDAIVNKSHKDYNVQKQYFDIIHKAPLFTIRLGNLIVSPKDGFRQKGVDILMAIDAITKAYRNQYDAGIFLLGDRDFIPLIEAVNDTGKKTIGIYYFQTVPEDLKRSFDMSRGLTNRDINDLLMKTST